MDTLNMRLTKLVVITIAASLLCACVEPTSSVPITDCVKVAHWVELGLQAEVLISDTSQDETYNKLIAERTAVSKNMSEHEIRFGETLVNQLKPRVKAPYADIYGICRKWETGNY